MALRHELLRLPSFGKLVAITRVRVDCVVILRVIGINVFMNGLGAVHCRRWKGRIKLLYRFVFKMSVLQVSIDTGSSLSVRSLCCHYESLYSITTLGSIPFIYLGSVTLTTEVKITSSKRLLILFGPAPQV